MNFPPPLLMFEYWRNVWMSCSIYVSRHFKSIWFPLFVIAFAVWFEMQVFSIFETHRQNGITGIVAHLEYIIEMHFRCFFSNTCDNKAVTKLTHICYPIYIQLHHIYIYIHTYIQTYNICTDGCTEIINISSLKWMVLPVDKPFEFVVAC